jgi:hypothetical protein
MIRKKLLAGAIFAMIVFASTLHSQAATTVAVRAGRLFDSKTGQLLTNQVVLIQGE